jgi:catechol 2,3-dioxygenase-like lactoylglutathione lyase family enzyme
MPISARYVHTNLIARDWRRLAWFYQHVFGCTPVPPERRLYGKELDKATGIINVLIEGAHLLLPGCDEGGPSVEIFEYNPALDSPVTRQVNRPGWGHIAFAVENVEEAVHAVLVAGGQKYGEVAATSVSGAGKVTFVYMTDPEGNLIELQHWEKEPDGDTNA